MKPGDSQTSSSVARMWAGPGPAALAEEERRRRLAGQWMADTTMSTRSAAWQERWEEVGPRALRRTQKVPLEEVRRTWTVAARTGT
jgi:hypothetical protein